MSPGATSPRSAPLIARGGGAQQVVAAALSSCCQELWGQSPCPSPRAGGASYGRAFPLSPGESAGRRCAGACGQGCCGDTGKYPAWPVPPDARNWALEDGIMRTSSQPSPPPQNALRSRSGPRRGLTDGSFLLGCFRLTGTEGAQAGARWRQRRARPCVHCEGRRVLVREALPRTRFRMASVVQTGRGRRSKFSCAQRGLVSAAEPPPRPPGRLPRPWPPAFETLPRWAAISTRTPSSHREPGARRPARHLLRGHPVQSARPRVMGTLAPSRRL